MVRVASGRASGVKHMCQIKAERRRRRRYISSIYFVVPTVATTHATGAGR